MSQKLNNGPYRASFAYSGGDLSDFEQLYSQKKELKPTARIVFGLLGGAGVLYFGYMLYTHGIDFHDLWTAVAYIGYLVVCGLMLVMAFHREGSGGRQDDTVKKYRQYYTGRHVDFTMDEDGIEMHLEKQKTYSKSPWKKVHGLYETDRCWYITIKNKAYYIVNKKAVQGGTPEEFKKYVEHKTGKRFIDHRQGA